MNRIKSIPTVTFKKVLKRTMQSNSNITHILERLNLSTSLNSGVYNGKWKSPESAEMKKEMLNPSTGNIQINQIQLNSDISRFRDSEMISYKLKPNPKTQNK